MVDALLALAIGETTGAGPPSPGPDGWTRDAVTVEQARNAFRISLEGPTRFAALVSRAGLSVEEAEVLALCCAVDLDLDRQRVVGHLQGDPQLTRPTIALLHALFGPDHAGPLAVGGDSGARRSALMAVTADRPWAACQVVLSDQVAWWLAGDDSLDPGLPPDVEFLETPDSAGPGADLVFSVSADRIRRLQCAMLTADGETFLVTDEPASAVAWEAVVRQATLFGTGVVLHIQDQLSPAARYWIERADHLVWAVASATEVPLEAMPRRPWVEVRNDDVLADADEWEAVFGELGVDGRRVTAHQLYLAANAVAGLADGEAALRRLASGHLEQVARRIRPRRGWDDIVLPEPELARLRQLGPRYRHRHIIHGQWNLPDFPSPGLVALFSGPSGTGKTMAAEIIAGSIGLDLFKVDVSAVVSKYIGETEKNLEKVFEAAASGDLVLLFDEADALLGKRSEVSDARDRYANLEVSYLLQRLESFDGFVLLTTNLSRNIDPAFLRRVHVAVEFSPPGPADRERIWRQSLAEAPTEDLDLAEVAHRFELTGGSIRNAALTAAFLAADDGSPVTMQHVVGGLLLELDKLGRLFDPSQFAPWDEHLARHQADPAAG
jgi:ATPase family associated with various cellular activities (AAA)/Winged helix domain, variant